MGYISLNALKILECAFKGVNLISVELLVLVNVEEKGRTEKHGYRQEQWVKRQKKHHTYLLT